MRAFQSHHERFHLPGQIHLLPRAIATAPGRGKSVGGVQKEANQDVQENDEGPPPQRRHPSGEFRPRTKGRARTASVHRRRPPRCPPQPVRPEDAPAPAPSRNDASHELAVVTKARSTIPALNPLRQQGAATRTSLSLPRGPSAPRERGGGSNSRNRKRSDRKRRKSRSERRRRRQP